MAEAARREDWPRTLEEFELWHANQPERWEFIRGEPRMMAPASMRHSIIKTNVGFELRNALAGRGCTVLVDGPQILTDEISAIPDVVVTCAPLDLTTPVIVAPEIIVEVMSPSSELNDTGLRWLAYRSIPSLKHYLVLSQDRAPDPRPLARGRDLARALRERGCARARRSAASPRARRHLRGNRPRSIVARRPAAPLSGRGSPQRGPGNAAYRRGCG